MEAVFGAANLLALAGWLALLASWRLRGWATLVAEVVAPALLAVAYTGLILAFWSRAPGGFGSLAEVMALFTMPQTALAGWLHYLAFDLLVGAWEMRTARREGIAFLLLLPCLVLTFLFGPAGFLLFSALRATRVARTVEAGR